MYTRYHLYGPLVLLLALMLAACSAAPEEPSPAAEAPPSTSTLAPTAAPEPTDPPAPTALPEPTPTQEPTIPPEPTPTPEPTPAAAPTLTLDERIALAVEQGTFRSRGLGADRTDWELINGASSGEANGLSQYPTADGTFLVGYDSANIIWYLERRWDEPILVQEARAIAWQHMPTDALYEVIAEADAQSELSIYQSPLAIDRFAAAMWDNTGGPAGRITGLYELSAPGQAQRFVLSIGSNPQR